MDLVRSLHCWHTLWPLRRVIHLSMTTNATPLSAVKIMQLLSFRLHKATLFSLVMLDLGAFWFIAIFGKHISDFGVVFHTVSSDGRSIFTQRTTNVLGDSNIVSDRGMVGVVAIFGPFGGEGIFLLLIEAY